MKLLEPVILREMNLKFQKKASLSSVSVTSIIRTIIIILIDIEERRTFVFAVREEK